jgi:hypothetical protein
MDQVSRLPGANFVGSWFFNRSATTVVFYCSQLIPFSTSAQIKIFISQHRRRCKLQAVKVLWNRHQFGGKINETGAKKVDSFFASQMQGCQMVCFQTKKPNLGKFWRALEWKMLVYFLIIWNILQPFVYVMANFPVLVYCVKIWQPRSDENALWHALTKDQPLQPVVRPPAHKKSYKTGLCFQTKTCDLTAR